MPSVFRFELLGERQIDRRLGRIELATVDATPAWEMLAESFLDTERKQFATQGGLSGGWRPLSDRYAAWKAAHYPGKPILQRTGDLARSLTEGPQIRVIEPHQMVLGTDVDYAHWHQLGTDRMPRRRPVDLPRPTRVAWVKVLQRWCLTGALTSFDRPVVP